MLNAWVYVFHISFTRSQRSIGEGFLAYGMGGRLRQDRHANQYGRGWKGNKIGLFYISANWFLIDLHYFGILKMGFSLYSKEMYRVFLRSLPKGHELDFRFCREKKRLSCRHVTLLYYLFALFHLSKLLSCFVYIICFKWNTIAAIPLYLFFITSCSWEVFMPYIVSFFFL